jgi:hypothetical protein
MGADIYLESVNNACHSKWERKFDAAVAKRNQAVRGSALEKELQKKVDEAYNGMFGQGYFRDCYNGYGLFAQMSRSWWADVVPMLDDDNYLPINKVRELRDRVAAEPLNLASAKKVAREQKDKAPACGWKAHYESWRKELLDILDQSIALGEPLRCSL